MPGSLRLLRRETHSHRSYAFALVLTMRLRVYEECVVSTIRHDVHEADQLPVLCARSDPTEAARTDSAPLSGLRVSAVGVNEFDHLLVG